MCLMCLMCLKCPRTHRWPAGPVSSYSLLFPLISSYSLFFSSFFLLHPFFIPLCDICAGMKSFSRALTVNGWREGESLSLLSFIFWMPDLRLVLRKWQLVYSRTFLLITLFSSCYLGSHYALVIMKWWNLCNRPTQSTVDSWLTDYHSFDIMDSLNDDSVREPPFVVFYCKDQNS